MPSRIADKTTKIPAGIELKVDGSFITIKGKKGELKLEVSPTVKLNIENDEFIFQPIEGAMKRKADEKSLTALRGTYTAHLRNMIKGVTEGFQKELEVVGIGYRAALQGSKLVLNLGYSHPIEYTAPQGITIEVPAPNKVIVKGMDKYLVGEVTATIRRFRQPNVYSGKGVRYANEVVNLKEGKKV